MFQAIPLFLGLGTTEIILIVLVVLLLFGGRKIPELMKGLGKGVKNFKDGMQGLDQEPPDKSKSDSSEKKETPKDPAG